MTRYARNQTLRCATTIPDPKELIRAGLVPDALKTFSRHHTHLVSVHTIAIHRMKFPSNKVLRIWRDVHRLARNLCTTLPEPRLIVASRRLAATDEAVRFHNFILSYDPAHVDIRPRDQIRIIAAQSFATPSRNRHQQPAHSQYSAHRIRHAREGNARNCR